MYSKKRKKIFSRFNKNKLLPKLNLIFKRFLLKNLGAEKR